ncbi:beta-eliminating lyase family protein [Clostridium argentinense CDC 2741]|uniref:Beta-eliminating lyase family protein n=1 Tax=Clostridium argentinense CDC 2741 TaxID=1418104 RepID=A0A0C1U4F9_9CLOT|nr:aminotransferase class V-fold PLP-dependent enzyme [Clostridium argentinense]ARC84615.1 class V aminotransferase [Clostridium argentinense]KIE47674.1 beta-eliminating lyase family protein [Clostridium argentinense CDC 2741]NFF40121.1 aminotransferase class V-fold PLP-dependent enzyme [Clostridium argentinense]NFP50676.1 aminotransferase class V-fold PLP-dependent enzyme [Clostridium argentinense]NFP72376.1 aminotransferase class V-fold PLP-dependent enzyme [Clostridium argentinense]
MSSKYNNVYRKLVVGVNNKVPLIDGTLVTGINFDNAATTPPLFCVLDDIIHFSPYYSSVHRGEGYKSQVSTMLYEESRDVIGKFVNYDPNYMQTIFVKNCSEAINKLCNILYEGDKDKVILSSYMEHHSNDLPWRAKYKIDYINVDDVGNLDLNDLENKLIKYQGNIKLVTITGASNVTGHKNHIYSISRLVHKYDCKLLVDGAQLVPHAPVDLRPFNCDDHIDFIAFSGHKIYAPFGSGVLIGPKETFEHCHPDHVGGGTISFVTPDYVRWASSPDKHEAGSPNILGSLAIVSSIRKLSSLGMKNLENYERYLTEYATANLLLIPYVTLYGDYLNFNDKVSIISFNIEGVHHGTLAKILSYEFGIAVRSGCFCAQPYMQKLLNASQKEIVRNMSLPKESYPGTVRISFGMYNTIDEINRLLYAIDEIALNRKYYIKKYRNIKRTLLD